LWDGGGDILKREEKQRLIWICNGINPRFELGYKVLATMVVFYRNAPNTAPIILRGNTNQTPFSGIFPRNYRFACREDRVTLCFESGRDFDQKR
jgi:hypothetical protein